MIGYVTVGTNDLDRAAQFFDTLFKEELGIGRLMESDAFVAWGKDMASPSVCAAKPFDGNAASVGNGVMVALAVENPQTVDSLYAKAISLGAQDEGAPGPRGEGSFYAAYFRDLDGNKFNAFCMISKE